MYGSLPNSLELTPAQCSGSAALSSRTRSRCEAGQTVASGCFRTIQVCPKHCTRPRQRTATRRPAKLRAQSTSTEGSIIVVMQRLHPDDLVGHLLEQEGWAHLNLPAVAEEDTTIRLGANRSHSRRVGDLLHPQRESQVALDELKAEMGSMEFAAQYQQTPVPIGGNLIKWSWFKFHDRPPTPQSGDKIIVSWDTALSSSQLADYSACVVLLARKETIYILDVVRARLEYPELKRAVLQHHNRWRPVVSNYALLIEKKGSGESLIQDLRRENIHAIGVNPDGDKILRMVAQTARIEAGAVHLPTGAAWLEEFKKEVLSFPCSKHDDQIDALSQALKRAFAPGPPSIQFGRY